MYVQTHWNILKDKYLPNMLGKKYNRFILYCYKIFYCVYVVERSYYYIQL